MEQRTVDLSTKRLLFQLDKLRGCYNCKNRKSCDRYEFVTSATDAFIKEIGLGESPLGQVLAQSLSWAIADEAFLSEVMAEGGDELYYEDGELHPLFYALESVRDHIRELADILLKMRRGD